MKLKGIILTMLSSITFGFAFTLGPMTYGLEGSNPVTLTFLRNFLSPIYWTDWALHNATWLGGYPFGNFKNKIDLFFPSRQNSH